MLGSTEVIGGLKMVLDVNWAATSVLQDVLADHDAGLRRPIGSESILDPEGLRRLSAS